MNKFSPNRAPKSFKKEKNLFLAICVTLLILLQFLPLSKQSQHNSVLAASPLNCTGNQDSTTQKLRDSVTFLPLKDLRFSNKPLEGRTWFMSSMHDTRDEDGGVQYQQFPSKPSRGRLLCLKGHDNRDALAWPEALPWNATLMKGLTFVAYTHYDFNNMWHGLLDIFPFVAWHRRNHCEVPTRWVLYHWGELRFKMATWLNILMEATFGQVPHIEGFEDIKDEDRPVCFEKAVVMRHNERGMARERRMEVYDLIRCRARDYCNVSLGHERPEIGMTMLMRSGPRSFVNETAMIRIFEKECSKVKGCRLMVAHSNNLTFCEQVKLMSLTDILISPHGAQLTNLLLMDRNSSVMEFFPKGWLKLAGVGQYVFRWMASWSGMRHRGDWRDPDGVKCPYSDDDPRCMLLFYKNDRIGYNETQFAEWASNVLNEEVKTKKSEQEASKYGSASIQTCDCS